VIPNQKNYQDHVIQAKINNKYNVLDALIDDTQKTMMAAMRESNRPYKKLVLNKFDIYIECRKNETRIKLSF